MPPILKQKRIWIPALCLLLVAVYALAGFLLAPKLLRSALIDGIHDKFGLQARVGEIRINPFLLQLEVRNFELPDKAGRPMLGFERLFVDFETSSLWHRAYVFKDIDIAAPHVQALIAADGRFNVDALKPKDPAPQPAPAQQGPLPRVEIALFCMTRGAASYEDHSRVDPIVLHIDPISFELSDFTTGAEGGRFSFAGVSKRGGRLTWQGHFSLQPLSSDGQFKIDDLRAQTLWEYVEHAVAFQVPSGLIGLSGGYNFRVRERPELQAHLDGLTVRDLAIGPAGGEIDWVRLGTLAIGPADLDLAARSVRIQRIGLDALGIKAWREGDGSINLLRLAGKQGAAAPGGAAPGAAAPGAAAPSAPWTLQLQQFELNGARIDFQDRAVSPAVDFAVTPLSLKVANISLDLAKPLDVDMDAGINGQGKLAVRGTLVPAPLSADLKLQLSDFALPVLQPYLAQTTALTLRSGELGVGGRLLVRAGAKAGAPPSLTFTGDAGIDGLHTVDNQMKQDLVKWGRLQVRGIDFRQAPDRLDIQEVIANKLFARVVIAPDLTLNVARVLAGPHPPPAPAAEPTAAEPATPSRGALRKAAMTRDRKPAPGTGDAAKPATAGMPINIRKVLLKGSNVSFTDLSLRPNFSAGINELGGSIVGLSSKPGSRAKIDLKGEVDKFSPVAIQGEANLLGPLYTDVAMSFRNMELTTFNPYSGKFAGYNISKGKLTTELKYKIDGRKLDAGHHIRIDQLEFGAKTASKDAVTLPVKLAVALLKDRNGVIDLDVPVTGSLDDPQFRLGPIIWKVVMNLLVKIVTSPFALLGSMFGGGPDLQFVDFPAGLATLDDAAQARVKSIAKALVERPQLKIAVPLAAVADLDRPALIQSKLDALLTEQQRESLGKKQSAVEPPAFGTLPTERQLELLAAAYKKQSGAKAQLPKAASEDPAAAPMSKEQVKERQQQADIAFLRAQLLAALSVEDRELADLAKARAAAIQQILLADAQIDPARVFLVNNDKAKPDAHSVRLELTLE